MAENLVYLGDKISFKVTAGKIDSIDGITKTVTSTKDANISSNNAIFFDRIDARFRTAMNDKYYSDWYDLKDFEYDNEKVFSDVSVDANVTTNIEIQYSLINVPNNWNESNDYISFSNVVVQTSASTIEMQTEDINTTATISAIGNNQGLEYEQTSYYNPYDLSELERLQDDLGLMAMETYGHKVDYVKVRSHTDKGSDYTLREYNLFEVEEADLKCLKVMVNKNQFPDGTLQYNQWGSDFPDIMEVHINHTYFQKIYDSKTIPQERDYLHFPLLDRVYEVVSVYMKKGLNMTPNYWVLSLSKWADRQDIIYKDNDIVDRIKEKADGLEDLFGEVITKEIENVKDEDQLKLNDDDLDTVRKYINPNLLFRDESIENYYTLISETQYDLNSLFRVFKSDRLAVAYKDKFKVVQDKATTLTFMANMEEVSSRPVTCTMTVYTASSYKVVPGVGKFHDGYQVGNMLTVWKKNGYVKEYLEVLEITSINSDRDEIICELYDTNATLNVSDVSLVSATINRTILVSGSNSYDRTTRIRSYVEDDYSDRFKIFISENNAINLEYFGNRYCYTLDEPLSNNVYYGFILSFNLRFNMFGLSVYEIFGDNSSPEMPLVQSFSEENFINENKTSANVLNLISSPVLLTNIRLFNEHLEAQLHSGYLSRNLINNASEIIIVDNAALNLQLANYEEGQVS